MEFNYFFSDFILIWFFFNLSNLIPILLIFIYVIWDSFYNLIISVISSAIIFFLSHFIHVLFIVVFFCFTKFFSLIFFLHNFILQHWVDLDLSFLVKPILKFHDLLFGKLTKLKDLRLRFLWFFCFFFYHSLKLIFFSILSFKIYFIRDWALFFYMLFTTFVLLLFSWVIWDLFIFCYLLNIFSRNKFFFLN
jgi:hypothetical protein